MSRTLTNWLFGIIAVIITIWLASVLGIKLKWPNIWNIIFFVPILALANSTIGSILKFLAMPITCLTLGLFGLVVNAIVFLIAGRLTGCEMNFWSALFGSISVTIISGFLTSTLLDKKGDSE